MLPKGEMSRETMPPAWKMSRKAEFPKGTFSAEKTPQMEILSGKAVCRRLSLLRFSMYIYAGK